MELYKHQKEFLERNPSRRLLAFDTGTGKTITAIFWANQRNQDTLIIVPKALWTQWQRSVDEHGKTRFFVITKEQFRGHTKEINRYNTVIVDEAHYFAGMKSQMSKSLRWYIKKHKVDNILLLTATPYLSTPWNIFVLATILGFIINYVDFKHRFFIDRYIGRRVVPAVRPGIEGEIAQLVARIGDVVRLEDCADVPEQVFETEFLALTPQQEKAKKAILEINPIVRFTHYHKIENGYMDEEVFASHKFDRIVSLVAEHDKIAIICRYNKQLDHLYNYFANLKDGKMTMQIRGATMNRDQVVQDIEKMDKVVVLIQADCSEGYELPSIGTIVFASMSFSYKNYKQMLGRFLRINRLKKNVFVHLVVKDGVDEAVYNAMLRKQDFDIEIYSM